MPESVLIVDDEVIIAEFIRQVLTMKGYEVAGTAMSGEEALRLVEKTRPDLILMDIVLEGPMTGIDTVEEIRKRHDIPVVYLTGNPQEQNLQRVKETVPYGYILKPVERGELLTAVEIALYRHSMERKLKESEERFRTVVESAADGICVIRDGRIRYINPALLRIVGYSREDRGDEDHEFGRYIHPDELPRLMEMYRRFLDGIDVEQHYETALLHKDGRRIEVDLKINWMDDYDGGRASLVFIRDITVQKRAQQELRDSEERFRAITEYAPFPMVISDFDGTFIYGNRMAETVFGVDRDNVADNVTTDDYYVDSQERDEFIAVLKRDGRVSGFETDLRRLGGGTFRALLDASVITYGGRRVILTVVQDISAYVEVQRNLRLTRFAIDHAGESALWIEPGGEIVYSNDAACGLLGFSSGEFPALRIFEIDRRLTEQTWYEEWSLLKERGFKMLTTEFRTGSGDYVPVELSANFLAFENTEYVITFVRDISERIKAEEEILDSRRRLYEIIQFLPVATFAIDEGGRVIAWNRAMEEMTGVKEEDVLGKGDHEYALPFYGERRPILVDLVTFNEQDLKRKYHYISRVGDTVFAETDFFMPDGRRLWLWGKASPLYNSRGEISGAIESIVDFTEQKMAEQALRASEERYRAIVEATPDAVTLMDINLKIVYASRLTAAMHGYDSPEEMVGMDAANLVPPEDRELAMGRFRKFLETGSVKDNEIRLVRKDGTAFFGELSAAFLYDEKGTPSSCIIISRDISERKEAEEKIRLSEEKFSKAFMASPMTVILFNLEDWRFLEVNDRFLEFSGYERSEVIGKTPEDLGHFLSGDERSRMLEIIRTDQSLRNHELSVVRKDGVQREGLISGDIITIEGERRFIAILVDVTEMKELQKEMSTAIEEERQRIGRDLHDDLGQILTGATFLLQSLKEDLKENPLVEEVSKIEELIRNAVTKTRSISRMLSPVEIVENNLVAALEEMVLQIEKIFVISCRVHCMDDIVIADSQVATNLFYIVREAVTNALKHSYANSIDIFLRIDAGSIIIEVRDDGIGIKDTAGGKGLGMRIMKYRAGLIGARVEYEALQDKGCAVVVIMRSDRLGGETA
ncbi:MAG: PAS domain S-box protein [Spirochaetes bacterium]|nr:PAS domain S-box protein [Spirochaetota bacterium]